MQRSWLIGLLVLVVLAGGGVAMFALFVNDGDGTAAPDRDLARRPPEPRVRPGQPGGERPEGGPRREGGMVRVLRQSGAMDDDTEKVRSFTGSRQASLRELRQSLDNLRKTAADENATDQQVSEALASFRQQRDEVKRKTETERMALIADLDLENRPRIAAALTVLGVLDSGLPFGAGPGGGGRGAGRPGRDVGGEAQRPRPPGPAPDGGGP